MLCLLQIAVSPRLIKVDKQLRRDVRACRDGSDATEAQRRQNHMITAYKDREWPLLADRYKFRNLVQLAARILQSGKILAGSRNLLQHRACQLDTSALRDVVGEHRNVHSPADLYIVVDQLVSGWPQVIR